MLRLYLLIFVLTSGRYASHPSFKRDFYPSGFCSLIEHVGGLYLYVVPNLRAAHVVCVCVFLLVCGGVSIMIFTN